ncbi:MAG: hypothetical protein EOP56_02185 [Sphingobacteriales bacterium]|nr:MAG: hypothetical protein EOP56_02185 [Sphingobacteriales bacterium]
MEVTSEAIELRLIAEFEKEFGFIRNKFEVMNLLGNNSAMDNDVIEYLKLPSEENNIVWHPGVYVFIGNNSIYRVGVSMNNSRLRVMQHLEGWTAKGEYCIWDIDKFDDKAILLFNVKNRQDRHWLLALEAFFEINFQPLIRAGRIG